MSLLLSPFAMPHHIELARREAGPPLVPTDVQSGDERIDALEAHPMLAEHDTANALRQDFALCILEHDAPRAVKQRRPEIRFLHGCRQHDGLRRAFGHLQPPQDIEAADIGKEMLEEKDAGSQTHHHRDRLLTAGRLADNFQVGLIPEQGPDAQPVDRMVFRQDNPTSASTWHLSLLVHLSVD